MADAQIILGGEKVKTTLNADGTQTLKVDAGATSGGAATPVRSTSGARTSFAASTTNAQVLAANANRIGAYVVNNSVSAILYLSIGATAATADADADITLYPGDSWTADAGYTGAVQGIWSAAVGKARVVEYT